MSEGKIVTSVDIGSSKVVVCIAKVNKNQSVSVLGLGIAQHNGIERGHILDPDRVTRALSAALQSAEGYAGLKCKGAVVNISGTQIRSLECEGHYVVGLGRVTDADVSSVHESARGNAERQLGSERHYYEHLHLMPVSYTVDGRGNIADPVGINGGSLEVTAHMISVTQSSYSDLLRCVERADLSVIGSVFGPVVQEKYLLTADERQEGVCLVDMGAGVSDAVVVKRSTVCDSFVIPRGGLDITQSISSNFRVRGPEAEVSKLKYGCASLDCVNPGQSVSFNTMGEEVRRVGREELAKVMQVEMDTLFTELAEKLNSIVRGNNNYLQAGVVLTGGVAKTEGILELARDKLKMPVRLAKSMLEDAVTDLPKELFQTSELSCALALCSESRSITNPLGK